MSCHDLLIVIIVSRSRFDWTHPSVDLSYTPSSEVIKYLLETPWTNLARAITPVIVTYSLFLAFKQVVMEEESNTIFKCCMMKPYKVLQTINTTVYNCNKVAISAQQHYIALKKQLPKAVSRVSFSH